MTYATRYQARKENSDAIIVKVDGGFVAMTYNDYRTWKRQK